MPVLAVKFFGVRVWMSFIVGLSTIATVMDPAAAGAAAAVSAATVSGAAVVSAAAVPAAAVSAGAAVDSAGAAAVSAGAAAVVSAALSLEQPAAASTPTNATAPSRRYGRVVLGFIGPLRWWGTAIGDEGAPRHPSPVSVTLLFYLCSVSPVKFNSSQMSGIMWCSCGNVCVCPPTLSLSLLLPGR